MGVLDLRQLLESVWEHMQAKAPGGGRALRVAIDALDCDPVSQEVLHEMNLDWSGPPPGRLDAPGPKLASTSIQAAAPPQEAERESSGMMCVWAHVFKEPETFRLLRCVGPRQTLTCLAMRTKDNSTVALNMRHVLPQDHEKYMRLLELLPIDAAWQEPRWEGEEKKLP